MPNRVKEQIKNDLEQARETGQLRATRVREIVESAVSQVTSEFKEGSNELRSIVKDAVSAVIENLQEKGGEIKEEVTASIEGAIEGVSSLRRQGIAKTQAEIKQLQLKVDKQEDELQQEVEKILSDIEETGKNTPAHVKESVESAINTVKNSDEAALMQKRYAQLQTQLAILKANLAARYGGRYEEVKGHLEEAKDWYGQSRPQAEAVAEKVEQKRINLESKIGDAGTSLAKRERRVKQVLSELLQSAAEHLREK